MAGVVLNTFAAPCLLDHLHIVHCSLFQPMGLDHSQIWQLFFHFCQDGNYGLFLLLFRDYVMPSRIDEEVVHRLFYAGRSAGRSPSILSTSSPKSSILMMSVKYPGTRSMISPLTRKRPGARSRSLRSKSISISFDQNLLSRYLVSYF